MTGVNYSEGIPLSKSLVPITGYTLCFSGGRTLDVPLRDGIQVAGANLVLGVPRVDAVTTATQRALFFPKEWARKQYQTLHYPLSAPGGRVGNVTMLPIGQQPPMLHFAITVEQS